MASFQAEFSDHSDREEELEDMLTSTTNKVQIQKIVFNIEDEEATVIPKKIPAKNSSLFEKQKHTIIFKVPVVLHLVQIQKPLLVNQVKLKVVQ